MNYVYLLRCADDTLYCGWTTDPVSRFEAHSRGLGAKYTRSRRPLKMVYLEACADRHTAMSREWHIKRMSRQEKMELINTMKKKADILFIGNSHTYYNDMPHMVQSLAEQDGFACRVTMLAHGGWHLSQHVLEPEVKFNIAYGHYDYVVIQEHAHPFGPEEGFRRAANVLAEMIYKAGSVPVVYGCWAQRARPEDQAHMDRVHRQVAEEIRALLAPVGEGWWDYAKAHPEINLFDADGRHASAAGSRFAAEQIWQVICAHALEKAAGKAGT